MEAFDINDVFKEMTPAPSEADKALIQHAAEFAYEAHKEQKRKSGEPYFLHVFETAKNLARFEMDATTIAAGFLHDVLEDTDCTEEDMEKEFGAEIVGLINGVTKLGHVKYRGAVRHVESLRKFLMAISNDYRVLMIKLADRLHNLKTLEHVRPDKQKRIALESIEVYAPLADRLGIGRLKGEIEDAAFPYAYPKEYAEVQKVLSERTHKITPELVSLEKELREGLAQYPIQVIKIDSRVKHIYSLWKKLQKYKNDVDKIYDIVALRVIVETVEECYMVLGIIHALWRPLPGRIKDFIALPKLNGYQSIHTTVFTGDGGIAEIQIRTRKMHSRAEFGIASHDSYKEESASDAEDPKFQWIRGFKDLENAEEKPERLLKELKSDFLSDRIYVFTPQGEVIDLPKDSTPIDFAYAIHSDIGNTASGARINGKFVSLDKKLSSNDIVEIETKKDGVPKSKWLDFVKTSGAKKHIKAYLLEHEEESMFAKFIPKKFRS